MNSKFCYSLLLMLPFFFAMRVIGLSDRGDAPPMPPITSLEYIVWAIVGVYLSQMAMMTISGTEKKIMGVASWILSCAAVCIWAIPREMNNLAKALLLAVVFFGIFFPISDVTTWRPWGAAAKRHHKFDFAPKIRR